MAVCFSYCIATGALGPGQQNYRLQELRALRGLLPRADQSGGRVAALADGIHPIWSLPITTSGVLFLVNAETSVDGSGPSGRNRYLCVNTVLLDGRAYRCVTRNDGARYQGVEIRQYGLDAHTLNAMAQSQGMPMPRPHDMDPSGPAQQAFVSAEMGDYNNFEELGLGNPEDNYQNVGDNTYDTISPRNTYDTIPALGGSLRRGRTLGALLRRR
jgi:hypothetical protein